MKIMKLSEVAMKTSPPYFLGSPEDPESNNTKITNPILRELKREPKTPK
jgi:hypothetical protein